VKEGGREGKGGKGRSTGWKEEWKEGGEEGRGGNGGKERRWKGRKEGTEGIVGSGCGGSPKGARDCS
jgi:hypothetical protein